MKIAFGGFTLEIKLSVEKPKAAGPLAAYPVSNEYVFQCEGCGCTVRTFVYVNYRTIPPSVVRPTRCYRCESKEKRT